MLKQGHHVFFIRERNGQFYLIDDSMPGLELRLPGCYSRTEAERLAWTLISQ